MSEINLLESGIYTIPDAAQLVQAPRQLVQLWIEGQKGKQAPVIENDLGRLNGKVAVSFANLVELRFIAFFHNAGVGLRAIRTIMSEAKDMLEHPHPFATKTVFRTDGRKIVAEIARKNGVENIYDLQSRNYEMRVMVMASLKDDVIYDPTGDAAAWRPRPKIAPHVIVHPHFSFGQPILKGSRVPTAALALAIRAERNAKTVSEIFEVPEAQVREAIKFEKDLKKAA